jgi:hypothetical protein
MSICSPSRDRTNTRGWELSRPFDSVVLNAEISDTSGVWYDGYHEGRVVGARRGNAAVVYYRLRTNDLPSVLRGEPLCIVRRQLNGRVVVRVFRKRPLARAALFGVETPAAGGFDYAGATASVLSGSAAVATIVGSSWAGPLGVGAAIFSLWWAYSYPPSPPETGGEVVIATTVLINDLVSRQRVPINKALILATRTTNSFARMDASAAVDNHAEVGDLVRVEQTYLVSTLQARDRSHYTGAFVGKVGFGDALEIGGR